MDDAKAQDEFLRIQLNHELARFKRILTMYDENRAEYVDRIENASYALGRLDERLEAAA